MEMSVEEELGELKRRTAEMDADPSKCIPMEKVYEILVARLKERL